jgi:GxxExxY protein
MKYEEVTEQIIKAFYNVYNTLGYGFLEKVYENAMSVELSQLGLIVERQNRTTVYYKQVVVGEYCSDITVNGLVICELKASEYLREDDECQLVNYLKATDKEVGLLLNFGKKPEIRRKIFDNSKKTWSTARIIPFQ